jgi:predicted enzyme related to lactoylglutathione lyase
VGARKKTLVWQDHHARGATTVDGLVLPGASGIGGAVGTADAATEPTVVVYVEVNDPHAYLEGAATLGATVVLLVTNIEEAKVTVGWLRDPQGNVVGVVKDYDTTR